MKWPDLLAVVTHIAYVGLVGGDCDLPGSTTASPTYPLEDVKVSETSVMRIFL